MATAGPGAPSAPEKRQFSIKSCLGRGGFGEVYRASMTNATGLETEVAVKLLHHDLDRDSQAVQRLRDEGRMLGALVHPSILRIYDFVVLDSRVGLVMEYVEGQDLSKCFRGPDPMPPRAIAAVIGRVADALRAAWDTPAPGSAERLQLIHRDIKPQNIRIGTQGDVKLLDFGVARASNVEREAMTNTGHMVGSYLYMAPECLMGNEFGRESDIFALGVTMYECLAHERLFKDLSLRELYILVLQEEEYARYMKEALDRLDAPEPLVNLLRRMTARAPMDRPTAAEVSGLADDLVDSLDGPTLRRWCRNRAWPPPNQVGGILDGRTITEATMATGFMPDLGRSPPPTRRRGLDWRLVFGAFGSVGLLGGLVLLALAVFVAALAIALSRGPARPVSTRTYEPAIEWVGGQGTETPERSTRGKPEPAPQETAPPLAPRGRCQLSLLSPGPARVVDIRGKTFKSGRYLPVGRYSIQVDWAGEGYKSEGSFEVTRGMSTVTIECKGIKRLCTVR